MLAFALLPLLSQPAFAVPKGFTEIKTTGGCSYYLGPEKASGYAVLRAECQWADVTVDELDKLLSKHADHDLYFSAVATSDVLGSEAGGTKVFQVHQASGISDREATLLYNRTVSGASITHAWQLTPTQPAPKDDRVTCVVDTGLWTLTPTPSGGATVIYELWYEPGGSVPGFVVRWFQTSGVVTLVDELHKYALAH